MLGNHMIDGQAAGALPTVLTGVSVPPENLAFGQFHNRTRPFNHVLQANN